MHRNWRRLIGPKALEIDREKITPTYGKFVASPLERGFGITIGNSLRRILLSSLQGAAVTSVKIDGVLHEFTSVPGIKEDMTDVILNIKDLKLKLNEGDADVIRIDSHGNGAITAKDLIVSEKIEVLNPDLHIATVAADSQFKAELNVKMGKGYVPAEFNKDPEASIGTIPVDSIHSPIVRCNYNVTNARVGQRTDYDKLTLEVWTNGAVKPEDAVAFAAKILKEQLQIFISFSEAQEPEEDTMKEHGPKLNENLYRRVDEARAVCALRQLSAERQYQIHRRALPEERAGDAKDQELRPQITKRDQRYPEQHGAFAWDADRRIYRRRCRKIPSEGR